MKFPNAFSGVKKIFSAEIVELIGLLMLAVASILAVLLQSNVNVSLGVAVVALVLGVASAVLLVIGAILNIVGLVKAGKDEANFKTALSYVIISAVLAVASVVLQNIGFGGSNVCGAVARATDFLVTYYIIQGIVSLADKLEDSAVSAKGKKLLKVILIAYVISVIGLLVYGLLIANASLMYVSIAVVIVSIVFSIVAYVLYISLLAKAKKMLGE